MNNAKPGHAVEFQGLKGAAHLSTAQKVTSSNLIKKSSVGVLNVMMMAKQLKQRRST